MQVWSGFLVLIWLLSQSIVFAHDCPPGQAPYCRFVFPTRTRTFTRIPTRTYTPRVPTRTNTPRVPTNTTTPVIPTIPRTYTPSGGGGGAIVCKPGEKEYYGGCRRFTVLAQQDYHQSVRGKVDGQAFYHATGVAIDENRSPYRTCIVATGFNTGRCWDGIGKCGDNPSKTCNFDSECTGGCVIGREPDLHLGQLSTAVGACNGDDNLGRFGPAYGDTLCLMQSPDGTNRAEQWAHMAIAIGPDSHIYIPDRWNNRINEYDADGKLVNTHGQDDVTGNKPNRGGPVSATGLKLPTYPAVVYGAVTVGKRTNNRYFADTGNNRILRVPPGTKAPNLVLGADNFTTVNTAQCAGGDSKTLLCQPYGLALNDEETELYALDTVNHSGVARILKFIVDPVTGDFKTGQAAIKSYRPTDPATGSWFTAVGIHYHKLDSGMFQGATLIVSEFWPGRRVAMLDTDLKYLGVIGSSTPTERGGADWCDRNGQCPACSYSYRIHAPGGNVAVDKNGNMTLADESLNQIYRYNLLTYKLDGKCIPFPDVAWGRNRTSRDRISGEPTGIIIDDVGEAIITRDGNTLKSWENYRNLPHGAPATAVVPNAAQGRGFFAIDQRRWLWTPDSDWQLAIHQLPLRDDNKPIKTHIRLVWDKTGEQIHYWTTGVAWHPEVGFFVNGGTRLLRIKDPENAATGVLRVDQIHGQTALHNTACNQGKVYPDKKGFCGVVQIRFDPMGNLWVVDNNYECHQNMRVVALAAADLKAATTDFPNLDQTRIINRDFTQDFGPSSWRCGPAKDRPWSPVAIEPYLGIQMFIANDGYGWTDESRVWRQIFHYLNPFTNTKAQKVIQVPIGAPGGISCDKYGGCAFLDHTWQRIWYIPDPLSWADVANP